MGTNRSSNSTYSMRQRIIRALLTVAVAAAACVAVASTAGASASTCAVRWGSLAKTAEAQSDAHLTNIRSGRHECFDRLVIDLDGSPAGYRLEYITELRGSASGELIPTRGGAIVGVTVIAPAYDDNGNSTYRPANRSELVNVSGYRTFRQVAWADTFEGQTSLGIGVRARLPYRVFTIAGPGTGSRLVIDVAHKW